MIYNFLIIRLGSLCGNSVNKGDFYFARTVSGDVIVNLTSITLSESIKFGRSLLRWFATIITSFSFEVVLSGGGMGAKLIEQGRRESPTHARF